MGENGILGLAHELQALASAGLLYSEQAFDIERYERIRDIAAELTALSSDEPLEKVKKIFSANDGYQTPKLSTRAAIFNAKEEILLVHDYDGKWVIPGGWCDFDQSIISNTRKEAWEEAGFVVEPYRLVGLFDHKKRNNPDSFFHCIHAFMLCRVVRNGEFQKNIETREREFFPVDGLPELNEHKTSKEQIRICLAAHRAEKWAPVID